MKLILQTVLQKQIVSNNAKKLVNWNSRFFAQAIVLSTCKTNWFFLLSLNNFSILLQYKAFSVLFSYTKFTRGSITHLALWWLQHFVFKGNKNKTETLPLQNKVKVCQMFEKSVLNQILAGEKQLLMEGRNAPKVILILRRWLAHFLTCFVTSKI